MGFLVMVNGWSFASRLLVTDNKTDDLRLDGYRIVTFHVQHSNDTKGETRTGEGRINFLLSFSYAAACLRGLRSFLELFLNEIRYVWVSTIPAPEARHTLANPEGVGAKP